MEMEKIIECSQKNELDERREEIFPNPYENDVIEYRGNRLGKTLVIMIVCMFGISLVLSVLAGVLFTKSVNKNKETISKCEELIDKVDSLGLDSSDNSEKFLELEKKIEDNHEEILETIPEVVEKSIESHQKDLKPDEKQGNLSEKEDLEVTGENSENVIFARRKVVDHIDTAEYRRSATNTLGEELNDVFYMYAKSCGKATFYLGNKYEKFTANISCPDEKSIQGEPFDLVIYANNDENQILYETKMNRAFLNTPIELNVSGAEFISFKATKNTILRDFVGLIIDEGELQ